MRFPRLPSILGLALTAGAVAFWPSLARAAEPTPSEISVARRLFEEGKAAEDASRWREAAEKFRQAAAIKDTPGIRFHLARCEEESGALVEALLDYDRARELIDGGAKAVDVERLLPEAHERVRAKVAHVTLRLTDGMQHASVSVDGKAVSDSVLGLPLPINPGRHRVQATAPGRAPFDKELQLGAGEKRDVLINPALASTPPASAAAPPVATPPAPARTRRAAVDTSVPTRTIVLVGEGSLLVAALGTGIYFTVARSSAQSDMDAANAKMLKALMGRPVDGSTCFMPSNPDVIAACPALDAARADRDSAATWQMAGFIGAGVSAAALGLTWWLWPSASDEAKPSVAVGPGRVDFALSGRF
jgi:hypothetical protein